MSVQLRRVLHTLTPEEEYMRAFEQAKQRYTARQAGNLTKFVAEIEEARERFLKPVAPTPTPQEVAN